MRDLFFATLGIGLLSFVGVAAAGGYSLSIRSDSGAQKAASALLGIGSAFLFVAIVTTAAAKLFEEKSRPVIKTSSNGLSLVW